MAAVGLIVGGSIPGLRHDFPDFSNVTALAQTSHAESTLSWKIFSEQCSHIDYSHAEQANLYMSELGCRPDKIAALTFLHSF